MKKRNFILIVQAILFSLIITFSVSYAEVIILKSGKQIEEKIIERTKDYIKIDIGGVLITYWTDEIESIDSYPAALETSSPEAEFNKHEARIIEYFLNRKYEEALDTLNEMMKDDKIKDIAAGRPDTYRRYGIIYYYLGRFQEAILSFEQAANLKPNNPYDYLTLGVLYDFVDQAEKAKDNLIKAIDIFRQETEEIKIIWAEALLKKIK